MVEIPHRLQYLADNYFYEDWNDDATTPVGVVELFVRDEHDDLVAELWDDLVAVGAPGADEALSKEIWDGTGNNYFDPKLVGLTYAEWIAQLVDVIRHAGAASDF